MESKNLDAALAAKNTATDGAYIMAQDASGNTIRIAKADLASVLADIWQYKYYTADIPQGSEYLINITEGYLIIEAIGKRFAVVCVGERGLGIVYESQTNFFQTDESTAGLYIYVTTDGIHFKNNGSGTNYSLKVWAFT